MKPVDTALLTDYLSVVHSPIDLGTIKEKLATRMDKSQYDNMHQFENDCKRVFENALAYNSRDKGVVGSVYCASEHLLSHFTSLFSEAVVEVRQNHQQFQGGALVAGARISFKSDTGSWLYGCVTGPSRGSSEWWNVLFDDGR